MANKPVIDPFIDEEFALPDFGFHAEDLEDPNDTITSQFSGLDPEIVATPAAPVDPPVEPVAGPDPAEPETFDLGDGATVTRSREKGQWKAVLDPGTGANPEVFWGKNKDELLTNVLTAKLNATKKIRELNTKIKLAPPTPKPAVVKQPTLATNRQLTADEIFEIKTQLESDPGLAFDNLFQKKYGLSLQQLVEKAEKGSVAEARGEIDAVGFQFASTHRDSYYPCDENVERIVKWIAKFKHGQNVSKGAQGMFDLYYADLWTLENIEEAFEDLREDGLLVSAPKAASQPPPPVVVQQQEPALPAPRPENPRIVATETRPRAALGIRASDVTPVAPPAQPTAPSAEDFESWSDEQVAAALTAARRRAVASRRS
jgi:hypothetical protein